MSAFPSHLTLSQVLEIENHRDFAETIDSGTGIPVWPALRQLVTRMFLSEAFYSSASLLDVGRDRSTAQVAKAIGKSFLHNRAHRPRPSRLMIRATGAGLVRAGDRFENRYSRGFIQAVGGDAWSYEDVFDARVLQRVEQRLTYSMPFVAGTRLIGKLRKNANENPQVRRLVDLTVERALACIGWQISAEQQHWLMQMGQRYVSSYARQQAHFARLLGRVRPQCLLVEEGCYGPQAVLNHTARAAGIAVAEFQHGLVAAGHDAYNFAPILRKSEVYRDSLPHYFLSYGPWWSSQINAPVTHVVVGNPHREQVLPRHSRGSTHSGRILVIGDGTETARYLDVCATLASALPKRFRVVFRPHPQERSAAQRMLAGRSSSFEVDVEPDVYATLADVEVVIGELSTVLFEAVGYARRIFVWDTPKGIFAIPEHPFERFTSLEQLVETIAVEQQDDASWNASRAEELWAQGWHDRFSSFMNSLGPASGPKHGGGAAQI